MCTQVIYLIFLKLTNPYLLSHIGVRAHKPCSHSCLFTVLVDHIFVDLQKHVCVLLGICWTSHI